MSRKTFIAITFLVLTVLVSFIIYRQLQIDRCLDNGGKWNSKFNRCDGVRSQ
jgi:hypothetical protein